MSAEIVTIGGYSLSLLSLAYQATTVAVLGLGLYPLLRDEPLQESLFFFLFCLAIAVWLFGFSWMVGAPREESALRWLRLAYVGVPIIPAILYTVAVHTLGIADERRWILSLIWGAATVSLVLMVGTDVFLDGLYRYPWGFYPDYSAAGLGFIGYAVGGIGLALGEYLLRYRTADREEERNRTKRYLLAFAVGSMAVADFLPCYGLEIYPAGYGFVFFMGGLMGHTIRRYHLTNLTPAYAADRILATMSDPVLVCDPQGEIRVASAAVEDVLGYRPDDLIGSPVDRLFGKTAGGPHERNILENGAVQDEEVVLETRTGDRVEASLSTAGLRDPNDRRVGTALVIRDIRERKALEQQLRESQKMDAIGRLAGGVAHDFNNLLTVILANADLLGGDLVEDEDMRELVAEIRQAAEKGKGVTDRLLTFSRETSAESEVVDLNEIVAELRRILGRLLRDDIQLETDLEDGPALIEINRNQMEQVIINLCVNAQDAMPNGGEIRLRTGRTLLTNEDVAHRPDVEVGPHIVLSVRDTGHGIDEEAQKQVFEPFFTTKSAEKGTGLGLSVVHGIIREAGGHVTVESTPGEGAKFTVFLPAQA